MQVAVHGSKKAGKCVDSHKGATRDECGAHPNVQALGEIVVLVACSSQSNCGSEDSERS